MAVVVEEGLFVRGVVECLVCGGGGGFVLVVVVEGVVSCGGGGIDG